MYRCLLLAVAFMALTQVQSAKDKCPMAFGKYPFDISKFTGEWYILAGIPPKHHENHPIGEKKCAKITFETQRTGEESINHMKFTCNSNNKTHNAEAYTQAYKPERSSMFYGAWKKEGETKWSGVFKQSIVATDYDNYAISIACTPEFNEETKTFSRSLHADVWGRKTTLGEETLKTLMNFLSGYDIDLSEIKMMDQTNC